MDQIAANLGKSVLAVRRQVARIKRRVREGKFAPSPLPIERAATQRRVYLAGFDVFRVDAKAHGEHLKQLCRERGVIGLYPLDGDVPSSFLHPLEAARVIYMANIEAIRAADFVMANLNDFRGPGEPDSGTAFEVGFAAALGKPVWGYRTSPHPLTETVPRTTDADEGTSVCTKGYLVEDFGLSVNLMLACAARIIAGGPAECLDAMKAALAAEDSLGLVTGLAKR
ncbi:nucleoside 2-deoxyribosyltransferase [Caballeronia glathei]|uniref:Nucleoside 2-deoxyribosyltransferase n=1 Tax=Caballeronia glathei TaxID=60547 RepID=A0A069PN44_9BURK|nr:nucleoside 2-deoxyribosyltransferase [Caballeronia glathei]